MFGICVGVELAVFVVEAVGEFVADGAGGVAVVGGVVHFRIVERGLKHSGGEVDVVHLRIEIGVDRGGGDVPLAVIHRLANFVDVAAGVSPGGARGGPRKDGAGQNYWNTVAPT